jgi:hypothetical protein
VSRHRGHRIVSHGGGKPGFSTFFARFVDARLSVIVLANLPQANAGAIAMRLADMYLPEEHAIEDSDPATTGRLEQLLLNLREGKADPAHFTPEDQAELSAEKLQQTSAFYQSLGPLQSLALVEEKGEAPRTRRYRLKFPVTEWIQTCQLTEAGGIDGLEIEPIG